MKSFSCEVRYGHLWVALEEPLAPVLDWRGGNDPGCRRIDQFYEPWNCAGLRLMENSFDNAHIHFVHRNTFGDINNPDPPEPTIERLNYGFVARSDVPVCNTEEQKKNLRDDLGLYRPSHHGALVHALPCAPPACPLSRGDRPHHHHRRCAPVSDGQSQIVQFCFRNDRKEAEAPAAGIIALTAASWPRTGRCWKAPTTTCRSTCIPASSATCRPDKGDTAACAAQRCSACSPPTAKRSRHGAHPPNIATGGGEAVTRPE